MPSLLRIKKRTKKYFETSKKQRFIALLFLLGFTTSLILPPVSIYAAAQTSPIHSITGNKHKGVPPDTETVMKEDYPAGMQPTSGQAVAAADAGSAAPEAGLIKGASKPGEVLQGIAEKPRITPHELIDKRTATTTTSVNADGSITEKQYFKPKFFKKDGKWADIDTSLVEDKNAADSGNLFGQMLGEVQSWFSSATNFKVKENDWQARFSPSGSPEGMVRVKKANSQIGFAPVNAKAVAPVITTKNGQQTVHYYDLWPGVDVEYIVESDAVKENIILKNKSSAASVSFRLLGADLEKKQLGERLAPSYVIKGALDDDFAIAPANLILNEFGFVSDESVFSQTYKDGIITVSVDKTYLEGLPAKAFPAVIDPTTFTSNFGTRAGGNYISFKSDGYVCYSNVCNLYAGSVYDSNGWLRYWRGAYFAPYDQFRNSNILLTNATLHLAQRSNESFWTGDWDTHNFQVGHATCLNNFNCVDGVWSSASFAGAGDINVTSLYQAMIAGNDFGAWIMVMGEDSTDHSFKNFDPGNGGTSGSYMSFTYGGPPSAPSIATPTNGQVYVDPQPSFTLNGMPNPNGSTPLKYELLVSTGTGASGGLITSNLMDATQWTVPDGILQDGSTYYVQARSFDPITSAYSSWGTSVAFRIDMRTGKDKTQSYDTLGPVDVDLATGNIATSASSHTSAALGGSLGISLDYNTPLKSRNGLVGEYWNLPANAPDTEPTTTPTITRVDQNIDFSWDTGSPSAGTINNDWYYGRWTGYFVAPQSGTYYFGGNHDDLLVVNVNNQQLYTSGGCYTGVCYGSSSITLQAGQVVPIKVLFKEVTGPSYAHLYVKTPDNVSQLMQSSWLQTGVRPLTNQRGLTGSYYGKFDGSNTFSAANTLIMKRTDPYLSFDWGTGAPVPGGPDGFLVRWSGYVTVPTTGTYNFGVRSDDGAKIMLGSSNTVVYNEWVNRAATESYGTGYTLTANTPTPIIVEYYDNAGDANFQLKVQGAVAQQIVPSSWLSPKAQVLPDGWNLGIDPDGNINYDRIRINQNSVVLTDSTGSTHEYTWTGTAYKPPVNEDGQLVRNADGTFTMQDVDGRTYVFAADGTLASVTNPVDDRKPAALKYTYNSLNGGPAVLTQITDGVDTNRWAKVYYSGDANCGSTPSGFDTSAPSGMLCAVKTNDNRATYFYYVQGQLARIAEPGNELTDYQYEAVTNGGVTVGYRISAIRDTLAMDAVAAGVRTNDDTVKTQIVYDILGRAVSVKQPAATAGAARIEHTIEYLPAALDKSYYGMTKQHIVNAAEPNGFMRRITYDNLFRTVTDTDIANLTDTIEWDPLKDLVRSTTDEAGLKSTTLYDDEDRPVHQYGPAPAAWFGTDYKPVTSPTDRTPEVPHTETKYDESITGTSVAWYDYTRQTGNNGLLYGAPKLHTTGIETPAPGVMSTSFTSPPITASSPTDVPNIQGIGFRATGKLRLPAGTYWVNADTSEGIRVTVDDQVVLDSWIDAAYRSITGGSFTVAANSAPKRLQIDTYRKTGSTGNFNVSLKQDFGFNWTSDWSQYVTPGYGLTTSTTAYDNTLGNSKSTVNYGANPELGLAQSSTLDPNGMNLTTSNTYETQGATGSFLRQTSKSLPGSPANNPSFTYAYYGANESKDNPCTPATETTSQAGFLKLKTEADPDGTGTQTGRKTETVYDDAGRIVATRYNTDSWTCTTYDSRGRVTQTSIPAYNGSTARTIQNDYAVGGNPLVTTTWDNNGWIVVWSDLLGRTIKYRDVYDDETTTTYDNFGKLTQRVSPMGTETYAYDNLNRLTEQKLDNVTYATVSYDAYSRIDHVDYSNAAQMRLTLGRDSLGRTNTMTYRMGDGTTTVSDTVTRTQSGQITSDVVQSGGNQLWYSYGYDGADRLTSANIGPHTYTYGFGTQDSTACGTGVGTNANSGKNGNRTTQTINGVTTKFCYDYADRLTTSTNPLYTNAQYDTHGNTTQLGTAATPLHMFYDSSDRSTGYEQYDSSTTGTGLYYDRDVQGRIIGRYKNTITNGNWAGAGSWFYHYTSAGDTPDYVRNNNWDIVEKTLQLPGGVNVTIQPQETANNQKQYSLPNNHGDTLLTTNAAGTNTSNGNGPASSFTYDPFGQVLPGSVLPANTASGSYAYVGQHEKLTESLFTLTPISMGARIYLPQLGRFTQVDPIEGGTENNYVYPVDPVNEFDLDGKMSFSGSHIGEAKHCLGKSIGNCFAHTYSKAITVALATPVGMVRGGATRIASLAWTKGKAGSRMANMMYHFGKHGAALGYKTPARYTLGAIKHIIKSTYSFPVKAGSRGFKSTKQIVLTYRGRIGSFMKSKNPINWIRNNHGY